MISKLQRPVLANYAVSAMMLLASLAMVFKGLWPGEHPSIARNIWILAGLLVGAIGGIACMFSIHIAALWRNVYWLAAVARKESTNDAGTGEKSAANWPWGAYHTELLGHLEAAARTFWVLYDPSEPSTAPTNEMVSRWLRDERGVSREKADAIASILRADGLKPGPRR